MKRTGRNGEGRGEKRMEGEERGIEDERGVLKINFLLDN